MDDNPPLASSDDVLAHQALVAQSRDHAMRHVFRQPDLLLCIGDHIRRNSDLKSLCLVNKFLRSVFAPRLFRELTLTIEAFSDMCEKGGFRDLYSNTQLYHVKEITISNELAFDVCTFIRGYRDLQEECRDLESKTRSQIGILAGKARECLILKFGSLLQLMPQLTAIHWDLPLLDCDAFEWLLRNVVVHAQPMVYNAGISSFRSLTCTSLLSRPLNQQVLNMSNQQLLNMGTQVLNLRSLTLQGTLEPPMRQALIINLLVVSPKLRHLALGSAKYHELKGLCRKYKATRAPPLNIQSLVLGDQTGLFNLGSLERPAIAVRARSLRKLIRLDGIKYLSIAGTLHQNVAWETITPAVLPNLRHLNLTGHGGYHLIPLGFHFLNHEHSEEFKAWTQQLLISHRQALLIGIPTPSNYQGWEWVGGLVCFADQPKFRINIDDFKPQWLLRLPRLRVLGHSVWWPRLTEFCKYSLVHAVSLESLYIRTFRAKGERKKPDPINKRGFRAVPSTLLTLRYAAQNAAEACPSLEYIKIEIYKECCFRFQQIMLSWRVTRVASPAPSAAEGDGTGTIVVRLHELDEDEEEDWCPPEFWSEEQRVKELISGYE